MLQDRHPQQLRPAPLHPLRGQSSLGYGGRSRTPDLRTLQAAGVQLTTAPTREGTATSASTLHGANKVTADELDEAQATSTRWQPSAHPAKDAPALGVLGRGTAAR